MVKQCCVPIFSILLLFVLSGKTCLAVVELEANKDQYDIASHMEVLENQGADWTIEDVTSMDIDGHFTETSRGIPNFGYTSSNYWLRFEIENQASLKDWVLEVAYPPHDSITLFQKQGGKMVSEISRTGDHLPFQHRDRSHRNFAFNLSIPAGESAVYYMKFDSRGAMQFPVTLWNNETFMKKTQTEYMVLGLYYGLAAVMIMYNLFLYFSLRLRSYLWYVLFILCLMLTHLTLNGIAFQYLWPEGMWWNNRAIVFFMAASQALALLFAKSFLNLKGNIPRINKLFTIFAVSQFLILVLLMASYTIALNLVIISAVLLVIAVLTAAGICWRRGYRPARYFFSGWVIFLIGVLLSSLADAGMIPVTFYTRYASQIGSAFEVILFSLALADKFNTLRMEKETAERKAKESQEAAVDQLKKANKLKDEFLANTSHELRTPLNGIIGIAESMHEGAAGSTKTGFQYNLSMIIRSGKRLSHLVNDLLDMSKLRHKDIELEINAVYLQDFVPVVLSISEPLVRTKHIAITTNIPEWLPPIAADENRLQQILHNIIGNAVKFTDQGSITISAAMLENQVELTVRDTGIGMTEDELAVIFDEFTQGNAAQERQQGGTGLGLNITKKLIELHSGSIAIESEKHKGTTATIRFPDAVDLPRSVSPPRSPIYESSAEIKWIDTPVKHNGSATKGHILIADDEPVNLQVLWNQLVLEGYQLTTAANGEEVIEKVNAGVDVDLIILDVMMPKKSGYEVTRELRERFTLTELPILILTARNQLDDIVATFASGANDYLAKPCYREELLARVNTLLTLENVMEDIAAKQISLRDANEELARFNVKLENRVRSRTAELEQRTEELVQLEKSRRHLLSNISHELGTPLTSLQGYVKAMIDGVIDPSDADYLSLIYDKVLFIDRLIQDLYDLSKLEARQVRFRWAWISVAELIDPFLLRFKEEVVVHNIEFYIQDNTDPAAAEEYIFVDLDRVEQVMFNLIYNALKFTEERGFLYIEILPSASPLVSSNASRDEDDPPVIQDRCLIVGVHDSGRGIASDSLPFIFDRFFRGEEARSTKEGNTGLGLAISKEIIEYHNGVIWAESREGEGSSFYFMLPLYPGKLP